MKKIILSLFVIFLFVFNNITYAYIDYRYYVVKDYYISQDYFSNNTNYKNNLDTFIKEINEKLIWLTFDEKVEIIEKYKTLILNYLFTYHIPRYSDTYYVLVYLYNQINNLKY